MSIETETSTSSPEQQGISVDVGTALSLLMESAHDIEIIATQFQSALFQGDPLSDDMLKALNDNAAHRFPRLWDAIDTDVVRIQAAYRWKCDALRYDEVTYLFDMAVNYHHMAVTCSNIVTTLCAHSNPSDASRHADEVAEYMNQLRTVAANKHNAMENAATVMGRLKGGLPQDDWSKLLTKQAASLRVIRAVHTPVRDADDDISVKEMQNNAYAVAYCQTLLAGNVVERMLLNLAYAHAIEKYMPDDLKDEDFKAHKKSVVDLAVQSLRNLSEYLENADTLHAFSQAEVEPMHAARAPATAGKHKNRAVH